jgi:hypothetical protein
MSYNKWKNEEPATPEIEDGVHYSKRELEGKADAWLRRDARSELCRECMEQGEETGGVQNVDQGLVDGKQLVLAFKEYRCSNDHTWYEGEGKTRGIRGDNPILFEEHIQSRKRREIYTTQGVPDPNIVSGIYNRMHPQGRKVNSEVQRKRNGASWYR